MAQVFLLDEANAKAEYVILNGVNVLLLRVDQQLMAVETKKILEGLKLIKETVGADKVVIALESYHYTAAINSFNGLIGEYEGFSLHLLENFYPAGDEQVTGYEVTGNCSAKAVFH